MTSLRTEDLQQFTGTSRWFRHAFHRAVIYTEGIQYLAEHGRAYWLLDAIAAHLASGELEDAARHDQRIGLMQFWKLAVNPDQSAILTAVADSGEPPFVQQRIPFTTFPLPEIDIWAKQDDGLWTLLLPREY